ncbi:MAG: pseudouridine-5'-phosphate glycosidase [Anaerolineales bacterium]|jgi:pseudouridine-5'-phosphate glycosidase
MKTIPLSYKLHPEVGQALVERRPVVALETAVVTHGLPYPENLNLARQMEEVVRSQQAVPATVGVLDGTIRIGLEADELQRLATEANLLKISRRDFATAIARSASGGTTVAGTLIAANMARIQVFATGGIGGVHRNAPFDISTDLPELGRIPMVVVCAGAKAILDLPATLEVLETYGVPVLGYQTDEFPAFYARHSGLPVSVRVEDAAEVAAIARAHWQLGMKSAVLVAVPPPEESALAAQEMEQAIAVALEDAHQRGISGQAVTPFLLARMAELTDGESLRANLALLINNAGVAAKIAGLLALGQSVSI